MCIYIEKIKNIIDKNIYLIEYISHIVDINYCDIYNIYETEKCNGKEKCSCFYIYNIIKYLFSFKEHINHITICCNGCDICIINPNIITYNTSNTYIDKLFTKSYDKIDYNTNEIMFILYQKNLPKDVINNVFSYCEFECPDYTEILYRVEHLSRYNMYEFMFKFNKFDNYFQLDNVCDFTSNCKKCETILSVLKIFEYLIEVDNCIYTQCQEMGILESDIYDNVVSSGFSSLYHYELMDGKRYIINND